MNVPPKAFKLKPPPSMQPSSPGSETPPVAVPDPVQTPPQNTSIPLKLKPAIAAPQSAPPQPPPQIHLHPPAPQAATQHGSISQGRLIVHNRASIVPPATPPSQQPPAQPVMTLRPAPAVSPEASPNSISTKPAPESFVNVKPALQKSSVYDVPEKYQIPDMSEDLQKILENESENYKDQLQSFVDLCETLSTPGWQFADIADYIHMLVRTVNLDVLSIVLTDPSEKGKFCKVISRGYKSAAPGSQIVAEWQPAVTGEAAVNWDRLMDIAADKDTKLCRWISKEGLHPVGYVPLHGGRKIYGFLFVGAYENKTQSALASSLLELCGDRIGVVLESRRSAAGIPSEKAAQTVKLLQDHLAMLASYLEVLKISARINPEEAVTASEKCLNTIAESKKLADSLADELASPGKNM